ncbi:MAG: hypothetical protein J6A60_01955 [Clostridia bacterium]|nr:hypothetical protein [Clostridia bacterium]
MKKIISVLLAAVMLACSISLIASAVQENEADPLVFIGGYSSTDLYKVTPEGKKVKIWGINAENLATVALEGIADLGKGLGALTVGNAKILADTVGQMAVEVCGDLACNDDGTSVNEVYRCVSTPEETNTKTLIEKFPETNGEYTHEYIYQLVLAQEISLDNIFNFQCDFRMGSESCAAQLDEYITAVKEYTGKDKVDLIAISHGGQTVATYLTLYGHKGDVDSAVLTVPAIGGAALAGDMLARNVKLDEDMLIRFIEHGQLVQDDYEWLVKAQKLGFLDDVIYYLDPYLKQILGNWGSIWDFAPVEDYEKYKSEWLDPVENAELIAKSDRFHYEIQPKFKEAFRFCSEEMGMRISIVSGTGNAAVTGSQQNSDAIITVASSTGATCAPFGERFADGYTQAEEWGGKYKVSPSMEIDASTAYLPDNTWFVNGLFHGMMFRDGFVIDMCKDLLFDDSITDVYSDERYPQFTETDNSSHTVLATFDDSPSGFLDGDEKTLCIKNIGSEYPIKVAAVNIAGADLSVDLGELITLEPGEYVDLELKGTIPEASKKMITVTVSFSRDGSVTPLGERIQAFTVMNGPAVEYGGENVAAYTVTDDASDGMLDPVSLGGFTEAFMLYFSMIAKVIYYWFNTIFMV